MRAQGGHLRGVRYDQNLRAFGQLRQTAAYGIGGGPTDSPVDFVKNQGQAGGLAGQTHFQCQQKPAEFAPRGDPIERSRRGPGVGGDGEGHLVLTVRPGLGGFKFGAKDRPFHLERCQFGCHRGIQPDTGLTARLGHRLGAAHVVRLGHGSGLFKLDQAAFAAI